MKIKNLFALTIVLPVLAACQNSNHQVGKVMLKTDTDSISYAIGVNVAQSLKGLKLDDLNYKAFARAIQDAYKNDSSSVKMTNEDAIKYIQKFLQNKAEMEAKKNKEESEKFMEENKTKEGVIVDTTGIQYKIIKEGTGPMPKEDDVVKVHFTGTLIDGTKFASSYDQNQPAQFKLNQVVKGWTIGLQKMKVGSKYIFYIPADLAYGDHVRPGGPIGPNQALIFEVELLDIVKDQPQK